MANVAPVKNWTNMSRFGGATTNSEKLSNEDKLNDTITINSPSKLSSVPPPPPPPPPIQESNHEEEKRNLLSAPFGSSPLDDKLFDVVGYVNQMFPTGNATFVDIYVKLW
jgi:hypothetical protein